MGSSNTKFLENRVDGKTIVVTGANTGIGKITAQELYKRGGRVILACRDVKRAQSAVEDIKADVGETPEDRGQLIVRKLDLSSFSSIKEFAKDLIDTESRIHCLINNAGLITTERKETADGFEMQFGVNHLGHFLLTYLLLPTLKKSAPARIINVSSKAHEFASIDFNDLNWETRSYGSFSAYGQSKLANVLFTFELAKRLEGSGVTSYALHPGTVSTDIARNFESNSNFYYYLLSIVKIFLKTPEKGALTTLYCALDESLGSQSGLYYTDCKERQAAAAGRNPESAAKLWELSLKMCQLEDQ